MCIYDKVEHGGEAMTFKTRVSTVEYLTCTSHEVTEGLLSKHCGEAITYTT